MRSSIRTAHIVHMTIYDLRTWRELRCFSARGGVIERDSNPLARYTVWVRGVVTDRDEKPPRTLVLALAGEDERVCAKCALGARCGMCSSVRRK
jgi:hypothetical protein